MLEVYLLSLTHLETRLICVKCNGSLSSSWYQLHCKIKITLICQVISNNFVASDITLTIRMYKSFKIATKNSNKYFSLQCSIHVYYCLLYSVKNHISEATENYLTDDLACYLHGTILRSYAYVAYIISIDAPVLTGKLQLGQFFDQCVFRSPKHCYVASVPLR